MTTMAEIDNPNGQLEELLRQVQAGNEVLLTQSGIPVARIAPVHTANQPKKSLPPLNFPTFSGPAVSTPNISRAEIAEDIFSRE